MPSEPHPATRRTAIQAGAPGVGRALARGGLQVASWGWAAAQQLKRGAYSLGVRRAARLSVPVLSVGNLTAGGTGKTPFVAWLAQHLVDAGHRPGILARGFGARAADGTSNDEGAVLRRLLGASVPQVQDPDRVRGGRRLCAQHPEVNVILLDDGYQHRRLHRDLDIVLLDATEPFGYDHLLPRGLLRERPSALGRAGAVVVTRTERVSAGSVQSTCERIRAHFAGPIAEARTEPTPAGLADELAGAAVYVLCGLGNPGAFLGTVRDLGARVVGSRLLADHEALPMDAWPDLLAEARAAGAECVVTTRKDAVKYATLPSEVTVIDMELVVSTGEAALLDAVWAALKSYGSSGSSSSGSVRS
ncbi:MAG: tetraacyldisaccharide 4'-kinase [Planctomycetota bacterium]|nr:tetraacyldisaccharide 4'-kinase [Planctomycetota bacterium]